MTRRQKAIVFSVAFCVILVAAAVSLNIGWIVVTAREVTPLYVIFRDVRGMLVSLGVLVATTVFLKKSWYDRLEGQEA